MIFLSFAIILSRYIVDFLRICYDMFVNKDTRASFLKIDYTRRKIMLFYFTGTGNSLFAARQLADAMNDEMYDICELIKNRNMSFRIPTGEKIGFVFPIYYSGLPHIVKTFLEEVNIIADDDCYTYAVITCGGSAAGADVQLKKVLSEKTMHIDHIAQLKMTDNYIVMFELDDAKKAAERTDIAKAELLEIAENISAGKKGGFNSRIGGKLANGVMQPMYHMLRKTKKFFADKKCVSCGKCERICPVDAIKMQNGKPKWVKDKCEHCMACINRCPKKAIQYGAKTKNKNRFVNEILSEK